MKKIRYLIYLFIAIIFLIVSIESISYYLYSYFYNKNTDNIKADSLGLELKDLYEGYSWKEDFFEDRKINKAPRPSYFPYVMWTTKNRDGLIHQDSNGVRKSFIPISNEKKIYRIYIYGGSTVENIEVPNDYTIASLIVKRLSESKLSEKYDFEIINFGSGAYNNTQSLIRFMYDYQRDFNDYGKPDLLVFFGGVNSIFSGVYLERPGIHDAFDRIKLRYDDINQFYLLKIREYISDKSYTVKLLNLLAGKKEEDLRYFYTQDKNYPKYAQQTKEILNNNIGIIESLGKNKSIESIFFLQPSIYTHENPSKHDKSVSEIWSIKRPFMSQAFHHGYLKLKELAKEVDNMHDLTHIFNGIENPIFRDYVHVGPYGNEIIANEMFNFIYKKIE